MSDRSSAPRLPLSPASPPDSGVKYQSKFDVSVATPQTPPSPDHMSVATKRYVSSYPDSRHTNEMANRSSENYLAQSQRSTLSPSVSQPQNNLKRSLPADDDDQEDRQTNKRQKKEDVEEVMEVEPSFSATNHERQNDSQQKQEQRAGVSFDDKAANATISSSDKAELDSIFKDVGPALLTRKTTHKRAALDMNHHLLGKYGLHDLLSGVARIDPVTGEKVNKLRKSYEGQIKTAALSGRNKPYKEPREEDEPSKIRRMATIAEEEFNETQASSKIGDLESLRGVISNALRFNSGTMPKQITADWDDVLGHEIKRPVAQPNVQPNLLHSQPPRIPNGIRPGSGVHIPDKMKTRGNKRSYGDASFDGYPGYADGNSEPEDQSDRDRDYTDRRKRVR